MLWQIFLFNFGVGKTTMQSPASRSSISKILPDGTTIRSNVKWVGRHFVAIASQIPVKCAYLKISSFGSTPVAFISIYHTSE